MIFDRLALSNRLASVKVDEDRIEKREYRDDREGACSDEGHGGWLGAEVQERGCDCTDIDGELELQIVRSGLTEGIEKEGWKKRK